MIYISAGANLAGPDEFQLNCSKVFITHFNVKHADIFKDIETLDKITKAQKDTKVSVEALLSKETLRVWLRAISHTFVDERDSPF